MSTQSPKKYLYLVILFLPLVIILVLGKEFWPLTSFPMYSKPYHHFIWPRVYFKSTLDSEWKILQTEKCFGRVGYVRFHFSILKFAQQKRQTAMNDLTKTLAHEITKKCSDLDVQFLKVSLFSFDVRDQNQPAEKFIKEVIPEINVEI